MAPQELIGQLGRLAWEGVAQRVEYQPFSPLMQFSWIVLQVLDDDPNHLPVLDALLRKTEPFKCILSLTTIKNLVTHRPVSNTGDVTEAKRDIEILRSLQLLFVVHGRDSMGALL